MRRRKRHTKPRVASFRLLGAVFGLVVLVLAARYAKAGNYIFSSHHGGKMFTVNASDTLPTSGTKISRAYPITGIISSHTFSYLDRPSETQAITGLLSPDQEYGALSMVHPRPEPSGRQTGVTSKINGDHRGDDLNGDVNVKLGNGTHLESLDRSAASVSTPEPGTLGMIAVAALLMWLGLRRHPRTS